MAKPFELLVANEHSFVTDNLRETEHQKGQETVHLILFYLQQVCLYEFLISPEKIPDTVPRRIKELFSSQQGIGTNLRDSIRNSEKVIATLCTNKEEVWLRVSFVSLKHNDTYLFKINYEYGSFGIDSNARILG